MKSSIIVLALFFVFGTTTAYADKGYGYTNKTYTETSQNLAKKSFSYARGGKAVKAFKTMKHSTKHFFNGTAQAMRGNGNYSKCSGCWAKTASK